jgi:ABC-type sugar transport system ATPase subunit
LATSRWISGATVLPGKAHCLLGDNGAGKSTLIKTLSGVHALTSGQILVEGQQVVMTGPRDALDLGIATVFQRKTPGTNTKALSHVTSCVRKPSA